MYVRIYAYAPIGVSEKKARLFSLPKPRTHGKRSADHPPATAAKQTTLELSPSFSLSLFLSLSQPASLCCVAFEPNPENADIATNKIASKFNQGGRKKTLSFQGVVPGGASLPERLRRRV